MKRLSVALGLPIACAILLLLSPAFIVAQAPDSANQERAARKLLQDLAGEWRFDTREQTGDTSRFVASRAYQIVGDSLRLAWTETTTHDQSGHGLLWYHAGTRRFLYVAVHSPGQVGVLLVGQLDASGRAIRFEVPSVPSLSGAALPLNEGIVPSTLRFVAPNVHTWSRYDDGWIITFERRP